MAAVVGFLDLNKQLETLSNRIETQLRNHWLDTETSRELSKEFHWKRKKNDVRTLETLLSKINDEIAWRKRTYGCGREATP